MQRKPNILLVEDNEDDRFLSVRVLSKAGIDSVRHAADGRAAIEYLLGEGVYADRAQNPVPDIVLLDLKIPEISGHQVLDWITARPELDRCQVFILSSSGEERDRERAADGDAAGYFVKPLTAKNVAQVVAAFEARG